MRQKEPPSASRAWENWSYSKLRSAMECPLKGFYEHILRLETPLHPYTALGLSMHYFFKRFYTCHKRTRRFPYAEVKSLLGEWFIFWWSAVAASGVPEESLGPWLKFKASQKKIKVLPHEFGSWRKKTVIVSWHATDQPERLFGYGAKILTQFHRNFDSFRKGGHVRLTERRFSFLWRGVRLSGVIDRVDVEDDGAVITDYKSSLPDEKMKETDLQMTIYQLAYEKCLRPHLPGHPPLKSLRIYNYWTGETMEMPVRSAAQIEMVGQYLREVSSYYRGVLIGRPPYRSSAPLHPFNPQDVRVGDITPNLPRGKHCRYCGYFIKCQEWEETRLRRNGSWQTARQIFTAQHQQAAIALNPRQNVLDFPDLRPAMNGNGLPERPKVYPEQAVIFREKRSLKT